MNRCVNVGEPATIALAPLVHALYSSGSFPFRMPEKIEYASANADQARLLDELRPALGDLKDVTRVVKTALASDPEVLNRMLAEEGLQVRVPAFDANTAPGSRFAVAAVLKVFGLFVNTDRIELPTPFGTFPAVEFPIDAEYYESSAHEHHVAVLTAKGMKLGKTIEEYEDFDIRIGITPLDQPLAGLDLAAKALQIAGSLKALPRGSYGSCKLPMVNVRQRPDIGWLAGLSTSSADGIKVTCEAAEQENWLRLSHEGVLLSSGTTMQMHAACGGDRGPDFNVNSPFLLWLTINGDSPYFAAYLPPDAWGDPGPLNDFGDRDS